MILNVELEEWDGSPVTRPVSAAYRRKPASEFTDAPADLTSRQSVFYRNLIRLAQALRSSAIPVDFEMASTGRMYLDRGCIKIAEHAGFIRKLKNDSSGVVSEITLAFAVRANAGTERRSRGSGGASKYDPLRDYLRTKPRGEFILTFAEIERVLGFPLPKSAATPQWWSNVKGSNHPQKVACQSAGFDAFYIAGSRKVRFRSHA